MEERIVIRMTMLSGAPRLLTCPNQPGYMRSNDCASTILDAPKNPLNRLCAIAPANPNPIMSPMGTFMVTTVNSAYAPLKLKFGIAVGAKVDRYPSDLTKSDPI